MKQLTQYDSKTFADSVWTLYGEMERKFGHIKAWEFILSFYEGTGGD